VAFTKTKLPSDLFCTASVGTWQSMVKRKTIEVDQFIPLGIGPTAGWLFWKRVVNVSMAKFFLVFDLVVSIGPAKLFLGRRALMLVRS
jgi:hypothetical protein